MYLLDTDHMSLLQRGGEESNHILRHLRPLPQDDVAVTVVSFEEQTRGWLARIGQQSVTANQVRAYGELKRLLQSYCFITVMDFDDAAALQFDQLRSQYRRHGTMDLKIAAVALAHNAILITRNTRDFGAIANLHIEDWSAG
jgi:tRNA(fMet)-specific endonuclease VapC